MLLNRRMYASARRWDQSSWGIVPPGPPKSIGRILPGMPFYRILQGLWARIYRPAPRIYRPAPRIYRPAPRIYGVPGRRFRVVWEDRINDFMMCLLTFAILTFNFMMCLLTFAILTFNFMMCLLTIAITTFNFTMCFWRSDHVLYVFYNEFDCTVRPSRTPTRYQGGENEYTPGSGPTPP